jgi:Amt family ammonium transporter
MLGYDDSLDAFGDHGVGGIVGAILTGVLAREAIAKPGLIDGNAEQVLLQIYGIAATVIYDAIATAIILLVIKAVMGLRVSEEVERDGLDIRLHGEVVP